MGELAEFGFLKEFQRYFRQEEYSTSDRQHCSSLDVELWGEILKVSNSTEA